MVLQPKAETMLRPVAYKVPFYTRLFPGLRNFLLLLHHHHSTSSLSFRLNPTFFPNCQNPPQPVPAPPPGPAPHAPSSAAPLNFNPTTVLEALSSYANDWKRALEFFNWVETQHGFHHTTQTYNRLIDILGKYFEFETVSTLIDKMKQAPLTHPDHATIRILFKRYISARLVNEAIDVYRNQLKELGLKDTVSFLSLVDALCEYKHVIEAEELCFSKNGDGMMTLCAEDDTKVHNMILRGWFKIGWWGKCREFWEVMDKKGVRKDLVSYSIYMDIQCKSGKPWKAVKLYKEMKKKGIGLDVVAYNTVMHAIGISDGVDAAVGLFKEMVELGHEPNVVTYNTIMKLFCENGRYKEAYKMLELMRKKDCDPNAVTYNCIFGRLEKPREILRLFDEMIESGVRPRMDTYVMLMRKFGRWGFLRPLLLVWKKMEEQGLSPDESAYNALIDALVDKGMIEMARKYENDMLAKGLSAKPRAELGIKLASDAVTDG